MNDDLLPSGGEWRGVRAWLKETILLFLFVPIYIFLIIPFAIWFLIDEKSARLVGKGIRSLRLTMIQKIKDFLDKR